MTAFGQVRVFETQVRLAVSNLSNGFKEIPEKKLIYNMNTLLGTKTCKDWELYSLYVKSFPKSLLVLFDNTKQVRWAARKHTRENG